MNATTNQKERRKDNEMYDDYYYEPSEFEQQIEEFKQSLLRSVKIEHVEEIERLRKENAELQATKKRMKEIETEHTVAMRQFSLDKQKYETELKNKRIAELLGDYMLIGWYPSSHTIRKPKCNKCDQNRNIHFKSPSGKDYTEECSTCGGGVSFYEPEEIECYRFSQRKDYYGSKLPPVEKYYMRKTGINYDTFESNRSLYKGEPHEEINLRRVVFATPEECQKYCDWKNKSNGIGGEVEKRPFKKEE